MNHLTLDVFFMLRRVRFFASPDIIGDDDDDDGGGGGDNMFWEIFAGVASGLIVAAVVAIFSCCRR